ncbi:hypothetical protein SMICM304S_04402 [Streptomyces microflavus]
MPAPLGPTTAMVVPGSAARARRVKPVTSACRGQRSWGAFSRTYAGGSGRTSGPVGSSGRGADRSRWSPGVPVQRPRSAMSTIMAIARSSSDTEVAASGDSWSSR